MKKKNAHGGKRAGSGRHARPTALKKTILIEKETVEIMKAFGDGLLGRGIDKAAQAIYFSLNAESTKLPRRKKSKVKPKGERDG
jgi:hypothetical protein